MSEANSTKIQRILNVGSINKSNKLKINCVVLAVYEKNKTLI